MLMRARSRDNGFSLIEALVSITLLALLMAAGAPALFGYLENSRIRSTAESFYAGAQTARAEAVRRNSPVELILTNDEPIEANVDDITPAANGRNWVIRTPRNPAVLPWSEYDFIAGKAAREGSGRNGGGTSVVVAGTVSTTALSTVTFLPLSNTSLTATGQFNFTNPTGGTCVFAGGPMQCLRVEISAGGRVHLCDPTAELGDTRRCAT